MGAARGMGTHIGALCKTFPGVLGERWPDGLGRLPDHDIPTYRLTRIITVVPLAWIASQCLLDALAEQPRPGSVIALFVLFPFVFAAQMAVVTLGARCRTNGRLLAILAAQAALTYLPILWYGTSWARMTGPLAAGRFGPAGQHARGLARLVSGRRQCSGHLLSGGAVPHGCLVRRVHGAGGMDDLRIRQTLQSRRRGARRAERTGQGDGDAGAAALRTGPPRPVGGSLSAVVLKGELAHRLVPAEACRARQEIAATLDISRQALTDLRLVAKGYRSPCRSRPSRSRCGRSWPRPAWR